MKTEVKAWGMLPDGREAHLIQIMNEQGILVTVSDFGGIIQSLITPDRNGQPADIVLGYDTLEEYIEDGCYFGATVGRCANRIARAEFELNGKKYPLTANENGNTLHGGNGFSKKLWEFRLEKDAVNLTYQAPDGENGFPGNLKADLRITLSDSGVFRMEYHAVSDTDTLCNLTGHSYFNLKDVQGNVADHVLQIKAANYTPTDEKLIPTGDICPVERTAYDFRKARPVGTQALDGNLVLDRSDYVKADWAARVYEPESGRVLEVCTDLPGIQLYNGGGVTFRTGKGGLHYNPQSGLCLEPQFFPDAIHHPAFEAPILRAGEAWNHYIEYRFSTD